MRHYDTGVVMSNKDDYVQADGEVNHPLKYSRGGRRTTDKNKCVPMGTPKNAHDEQSEHNDAGIIEADMLQTRTLPPCYASDYPITDASTNAENKSDY